MHVYVWIARADVIEWRNAMQTSVQTRQGSTFLYAHKHNIHNMTHDRRDAYAYAF